MRAAVRRLRSSPPRTETIEGAPAFSVRFRLAVHPGVDNHPNEIGHRIGATAIYRFLLRSRSIDRVYATGPRARMSEAYWLRRVRRKRSPQFFVPSEAAAAANGDADEPTGE